MGNKRRVTNAEIIEGMFGETILGMNVKGFISKVGDRFFFGYQTVNERKILQVEEIRDLSEAIQRLNEETYFWGRF
jgi:hypothetical protein